MSLYSALRTQAHEATPQQTWGTLSALFSVGLTVALGFVATDGNAVAAILAILAVVGQFASAWLFSNHRKADPAHARTIVRQIMAIVDRLASTVQLIETVQERREPAATTAEIRSTLTRVNVLVSTVAEDGVRVVESWGDFDPATLRQLGWISGSDENGNPENEGRNDE